MRVYTNTEGQEIETNEEGIKGNLISEKNLKYELENGVIIEFEGESLYKSNDGYYSEILIPEFNEDGIIDGYKCTSRFIKL